MYTLIEKQNNRKAINSKHQHYLSKNRAAVTQLIKAYRVGTTASKYKIEADAGKITKFSGGSSGIDISFGNADHAEYYFQTKKSDDGSEMVEWDFPDNVYEMIKLKMNNSGGKKIDHVKHDPIWNDMKNLSKPVNSTDQIVVENNLKAPHFGKDWIPFLNKYCKGSNALTTTHEMYFEAPEVDVQIPVEITRNTDGYAYNPEDEWEGESYMNYGDYEDRLLKDYGYIFVAQ